MKRVFLLLSTCCSVVCFGSPVQSMLGADGTEMSEGEEFINPYIADGLVAMWDAEWNAGYGIHDDQSPVWKDLVGDNDLVLNEASEWYDNYMRNPPNTKGAIGQHWADGSVTIEVVMQITGFYHNNQIPFIVYNKVDENTYRGIGKRYEWLTNGVKNYHADFRFSSVYPFSVSLHMGLTFHRWSPSFLDGQALSLTLITTQTHTIDEESVYLNAGTYAVRYFTIRLYDRELTEEEVLHNYEIDAERFGL